LLGENKSKVGVAKLAALSFAAIAILLDELNAQIEALQAMPQHKPRNPASLQIFLFQDLWCMHINALPVLACSLSEVVAKGNFLIPLLLVSRMFEFASLSPEACPFVVVATHLPPTVIPGTFHFLK